MILMAKKIKRDHQNYLHINNGLKNKFYMPKQAITFLFFNYVKKRAYI